MKNLTDENSQWHTPTAKEGGRWGNLSQENNDRKDFKMPAVDTTHPFYKACVALNKRIEQAVHDEVIPTEMIAYFKANPTSFPTWEALYVTNGVYTPENYSPTEDIHFKG